MLINAISSLYNRNISFAKNSNKNNSKECKIKSNDFNDCFVSSKEEEKALQKRIAQALVEYNQKFIIDDLIDYDTANTGSDLIKLYKDSDDRYYKAYFSIMKPGSEIDYEIYECPIDKFVEVFKKLGEAIENQYPEDTKEFNMLSAKLFNKISD